MIKSESLKELVPYLSEVQKRDILAYHKVYERHAEEFTRKATEDLKGHPVFGQLILSMPNEVREASNKLSLQLQKEAIENGDWEPYIKYQVEQGIGYAKMGLDFKSWYEVVGLVRKYITPYLVGEYGHGSKFLSAFNGMNSFMDLAMGIIGEAYLREKNQRIREANELLASIFDATADMLFVLDVDDKDMYRFSSVNRAFLKTTGLAYDAVQGRYLSDVVPKASVDLTLQNCNEAVKHNKIMRWEETSHYPSGILSLEVAVAPVYNEGSSIRLVGSVHDVTKRKNVETELRKSFKEVSDYKFALDTFCIVTITTQDGTIQYANENFSTITKYAKEELIGKDHRIINSGSHPKEFIRSLWQTIGSGKVWRGEIQNRAKDGSSFWVDTAIVPFLNEKGQPYQYVAISSDITERKRTEQEIMSLNDALEQKVIERTAQYQSVNKEMAAFTYSVSHDLRAPLRAVNGYAKMLMEEYGPALDGEGNRIVSNIIHNSSKMGILIDDLLSFSRLGRKEIVKSKVNMNELVENVLTQINRSTAHHANIQIEKLAEVEADYNLMYQVMSNLISNGIKYSSKTKHPVIWISSKEMDEEFIFIIKDNGAGFNMDYTNKLFGVFQRLHTEEEFEGTGVGLAIVKSIIDKHGGKVWAEGIVDQGATFYFSLPKK